VRFELSYMGVYARAVPALPRTTIAALRTERHGSRPRRPRGAAHRACHVAVVAPSMGAGRRGGRRGVSGRVAALGDDGVFEPEVEGEEGADEGTPRWAQLIEALLDHGIDGA
jgi:hypothetical protein